MRTSPWLIVFCFISQLAFFQLTLADATLDEVMSKAESGDANAQLQLGTMYSTGDLASGVSKNDMRAIKWYTKAAEQGSVEAQVGLALIYYKGNAVTQNHKQAMDWFTKAAESGNTEAQQYLAEMLRHGKGVPKNFKSSYVWYSICCSSGDKMNDKKEVWKHLTDAEIREANAEVEVIKKKIEQNKGAKK